MGGSGAGIGPSWVDVNGPFWGCFNKGLLLLLLLLLSTSCSTPRAMPAEPRTSAAFCDQ